MPQQVKDCGKCSVSEKYVPVVKNSMTVTKECNIAISKQRKNNENCKNLMLRLQ